MGVKRAFLYLIGVCAVGAVIGPLVALTAPPSGIQSSTIQASGPGAPLDVSIDNLKWRRGGFGGVAIATFTMENPNDFQVKDIVIVCDFFGSSGTKINTAEQIVYQAIDAHKKKIVSDFNLGFINSQASAGNCEVAGFRWYGGAYLPHLSH